MNSEYPVIDPIQLHSIGTAGKNRSPGFRQGRFAFKHFGGVAGENEPSKGASPLRVGHATPAHSIRLSVLG